MRSEEAARRRPPKRARMLLPIWGYKYVRDFLDVSLPTWLAPGNVPAVAAALPTEFVLLASREDEPYFRIDPAFKRLAAACKVRFHYIDHLITSKNYSTTITLAYLEAVRHTGDEATDTCFFFLVSDYIVADGSFRNALQRVLNGASGVLVGNFQLSEEGARPWLDAQLAKWPKALSLSARQLMRWGLAHLHPNTIANIVNFGLSHNSHSNRLFWFVDGQSLIGRFFLMHMICIRPERTDFEIGAACDYSFVPEMCPSDNVEIITDSDEYLVLEMQPGHHEQKFLSFGRQSPAELARSLEEWVTARHSKNADTTVVFHADDVPERLDEVVKKADSFIAMVKSRMRKKPAPHSNHPYWTGAIASHKEAVGIKLDKNEQPHVFSVPDRRLNNSLARWVIYLLFRSILGRMDSPRRWHPRWPDYRLVRDRLRVGLSSGMRLLLITDNVTACTVGIPDGTDRIVRIRSSEVMRRSPELLGGLSESFDMCLVEFRAGDLTEDTNGIRIDEVVDRIAPLIRKNGRILVSVVGDDGPGKSLAVALARHANQLLRPYATSVLPLFVPMNRFRSEIIALQASVARGAAFGTLGGWIGAAMLTPLVLPINFIINQNLRFKKKLLEGESLSSALFEVAVDAGLAREYWEYSAQRQLREQRRRRAGIEAAVLATDETIGQPADLELLLSPSKWSGSRNRKAGGAKSWRRRSK